jgi:hypothetical protein
MARITDGGATMQQNLYTSLLANANEIIRRNKYYAELITTVI